MKTFMLLSAIPGSGKSTWAEEYKLTHDNVFIVSSDELRKVIGGAYQNFEHEEEMWERFHQDILKYRDFGPDVTVIADATNISNKLRKYYAEITPGFDHKILVVFKKDPKDVLKTNKERCDARIVPDFAMERMINNWEDPDEEVKKLYNEIIYVTGKFEAPHVDNEFHYK